MIPNQNGSNAGRALIYLRTSTRNQLGGYSLAAQQTRCSDFCDRNGWYFEDPDDIFVEQEGSSDLSERPAFVRLLMKARNSPGQYRFLVVSGLDRLVRFRADHLRMIRLLDAHGLQLRALDASEALAEYEAKYFPCLPGADEEGNGEVLRGEDDFYSGW